MNILIYGHSQSGGMGHDLRDLLKKQGNTVKVVTHNGWNDFKLLDELPSELSKSAYDKVYLFVGGNYDGPTESQIAKMVELCGGPEIAQAILPPYNADKTPDTVFNDTSLKGYKNRVALKNLGIKVWVGRFPGKDFSPDKIHVKEGSSGSKKFAEIVVKNGYESEVNITSAVLGTTAIILLVISLVVLYKKRSNGLV